jgi:outer membrane protein OmpA-like peptidoglycan-associated protein
VQGLPAILSSLALCSVFAGCASAPRSYPALEAARADVAAAKASPDAERYAPLQLHKADELLQSAQQAAQRRQGEEVDYYSYLATQNSALALALASGKAADAHVAEGDVERQRIQLAARTREAEAARAAAESATARADNATAQAEAATAQAEAATAQAQSATTRAETAEAGQQRFQDELQQLQAQQTERGTVITLKDVLFATGRSELLPGAERSLDQLATALKDAPDRALDVEGFTDAVGDDAFNQTLSEQRAMAVRQALVDRGVDGARITSHGYGKQYPVASNSTSEGRQLNRRVEIVLAQSGNQVPTRQSLADQR